MSKLLSWLLVLFVFMFTVSTNMVFAHDRLENSVDDVDNYARLVGIFSCFQQAATGEQHTLSDINNKRYFRTGVTDSFDHKVPVGNSVNPSDGVVECSDEFSLLSSGFSLVHNEQFNTIDKIEDYIFQPCIDTWRTFCDESGDDLEYVILNGKYNDVMESLEESIRSHAVDGRGLDQIYPEQVLKTAILLPLSQCVDRVTGNGISNISIPGSDGEAYGFKYKDGVDSSSNIRISIPLESRLEGHDPLSFPRNEVDAVIAGSSQNGTTECDDLVSAAKNLSMGDFVEGSEIIDNVAGDGSVSAGSTDPTCESEAESSFGWLFCTPIRAMLTGLDTVLKDNLIHETLQFEYDDTGETALRSVWAGFNAIASILFVIAFMIIIYSAASGGLMSAYDVKSMLPRLFAAAILTQLSFTIGMFALQLTNVIGANLESLILFPLANDSNDLIPVDLREFYGGDTSDAVLMSAAILVLGGLALAGVFSMLGTAVVALTILFLVFVVRNIGITALIVVSPLAFVAYVLPGTNDYFQKWWKWFFGLLAVYPIMIAFIASGRLVGAIWSSSSGSDVGFINGSIALLATFIPYFFAVKALGMAGSVTGSMGRLYSGLRQTAANSRKSISDNETYKRTKARAKNAGLNNRFVNRGINNLQKRASSARNDEKILGGFSGVASRTASKAFSSNAARRTRAQSAYAVEQYNKQDEQAAEVLLSNSLAGQSRDEQTETLRSLAHNTKESPGMRRAAVKRMITNKDAAGLTKLVDDAHSSGSTSELEFVDRTLQQNGGDIASNFRHLIVPGERKFSSADPKKVVYDAGAVASAQLDPQTMAGQHKKEYSTVIQKLSTTLTSSETSTEQKLEARSALIKMHDTFKTISSDSQLKRMKTDEDWKDTQTILDQAMQLVQPGQPNAPQSPQNPPNNQNPNSGPGSTTNP